MSSVGTMVPTQSRGVGECEKKNICVISLSGSLSGKLIAVRLLNKIWSSFLVILTSLIHKSDTFLSKFIFLFFYKQIQFFEICLAILCIFLQFLAFLKYLLPLFAFVFATADAKSTTSYFLRTYISWHYNVIVRPKLKNPRLVAMKAYNMLEK